MGERWPRTQRSWWIPRRLSSDGAVVLANRNGRGASAGLEMQMEDALDFRNGCRKVVGNRDGQGRSVRTARCRGGRLDIGQRHRSYSAYRACRGRRRWCGAGLGSAACRACGGAAIGARGRARWAGRRTLCAPPRRRGSGRSVFDVHPPDLRRKVDQAESDRADEAVGQGAAAMRHADEDDALDSRVGVENQRALDHVVQRHLRVTVGVVLKLQAQLARPMLIVCILESSPPRLWLISTMSLVRG